MDKFEEFQTIMEKNNELFTTFRQEMEKVFTYFQQNITTEFVRDYFKQLLFGQTLYWSGYDLIFAQKLPQIVTDLDTLKIKFLS